MDACVLGRIGYDLYAEEQGVSLRRVKRFSRYLGGSSANVAVGLARLGLTTGIIGCVGDDPLGDFLIDDLNNEGVCTESVERIAGLQSSLCLCEVSPPDHFPQVFYRSRAADTQLEVSEGDLQSVSRAGLFVTNGTSLCESPSRESTFRALEHARSHGVKIAFDVDYRSMSWKSGQEAGLYARLALPYTDVLLANQEELAILTGTGECRQAVEAILKQGVPLVVAKLGSQGTLAATLEDSLFLPSFPAPVVSTIGAGDGFAAGFLYAQARGLPVAESLRYGNASAAIVVGRLMCAQAMPRLKELERFLNRYPDCQPRHPEQEVQGRQEDALRDDCAPADSQVRNSYCTPQEG